MFLKIGPNLIESDRITQIKLRPAPESGGVDVVTVYFEVSHVDFRGREAHAVLEFFESLSLDIDPDDPAGRNYLRHRRHGGDLSRAEFDQLYAEHQALAGQQGNLKMPQVVRLKQLQDRIGFID